MTWEDAAEQLWLGWVLAGSLVAFVCFFFQEAKAPGQQMLRWGLFLLLFLILLESRVLPERVADACLRDLKEIAAEKDSTP